MKKRLKKKLEKENIFINNFISEYRQLNKIKRERDNLQDSISRLRTFVKRITPNEVVISKAMYFALVGYLPKDLKLFISSLDSLKFPLKLGGIQIAIGSGIINKRGISEEQKILEEIFIEEVETKKEEKYVIFLFKGFNIRIKVPITIQNIKTKLRGVEVETTCWNWDFIHSGIRIISDNDFSTLIVFYKTAIELGSLMGMDEKTIEKYKPLKETLGDY